MKYYRIPILGLTALLLFIQFGFSSCTSNTTSSNTDASAYAQVNLVADTTSFGAAKLEPRLGNAWGIGVDPVTGNMEVGVNHAGEIFVYDRNATLIREIIVPLPTGATGGSPTGVVHNSTADFLGTSVITATEEGAIMGWTSGPRATISYADTTSVYKSIALGSSGGANYLYAANFGKNEVDMFDKNVLLHKQFTDPATPAGYAAFGVGIFNNMLYVTFARQKVGAHDDSAGPGIGFVDQFTLDGSFVKRLVTGGVLNSPFGLAMAGDGFGQFKNDLLISNFGDGNIYAFDPNTGALIGQLKDQSGSPITIEGRWSITFNTAPGGDPNLLYFGAGPSEENFGVFGYVQLK